MRRIVLFGSLVSGIPTPRSDADILMLVSESEFTSPRDRLPEGMRWLSPLPCPVDLWIVTEVEGLVRRDDSPLLRTALSSGMDLLSPATDHRSP